MRGPVQETKALRHAFRDVSNVPGYNHARKAVDVQHPLTSQWITCPPGDGYADAMTKAQAHVASLPELKGYSL